MPESYPPGVAQPPPALPLPELADRLLQVACLVWLAANPPDPGTFGAFNSWGDFKDAAGRAHDNLYGAGPQ